MAAIHNNFKGNNSNINNYNHDDDIICLTQSINNTILNSRNNGSDENIHISTGNNDIQIHESNPFMTAKQALARNINNKQLGHSSNIGNTGNSNASSYNSSMQARKLLGAKRRFVDPKSNGANESDNYRDEGRDINTEFRYKKK